MSERSVSYWGLASLVIGMVTSGAGLWVIHAYGPHWGLLALLLGASVGSYTAAMADWPCRPLAR